MRAEMVDFGVAFGRDLRRIAQATDTFLEHRLKGCLTAARGALRS